MQSKVVEFKKIKVRNFLSCGDDPIEIHFNKGITFITGYNKDSDSYNGVGKTSLIVESLSFLLFGETYRDINQKLIKNKFGGKTCIVEGWLKVNDDDIHIARGISPNKLILTVNGDSDKFTKTIPETTKDIIDRIGVSKTVFTNTIVMTNRESMSFLNQKKDIKTKFIEGILGLEAFAEFLKIAKDEYKIIEEEKSKMFQEITIIERGLEQDKQYHIQYIDKNRKEIEDILNEIQRLKACQPIDNTIAINQLHVDKTNLEEAIKLKEDKIQTANNKKFEKDYELNQYKKNLSALSNKITECPSCKRPFEEHDKEQIEKEKKDINEAIKNLSDSISKFQNAINKVRYEIDDYKKQVRTINDKISLLNIEQQRYANSQAEIILLQLEHEKLCNYVSPFSNKIQQTEKTITEKKLNYTNIIHKSHLANLIKEAASPTGIKAIMIKKTINALNDRINYYLSRLNSPFRVEFDEFFEESVKSLSGEEYSYGSLSGGESKRVDFAMLFAFRDIRRLQSNVDINLTVMDELFDSALCEHGMQQIMNLLKENIDECFMIVTHRPGNIDADGCETIHLIKENNITRLNTDI